MPEVRGKKLEGKAGSGKKKRKSFRYLGIEREFPSLRTGQAGLVSSSDTRFGEE
jgi:hypothetical protein